MPKIHIALIAPEDSLGNLVQTYLETLPSECEIFFGEVFPEIHPDIIIADIDFILQKKSIVDKIFSENKKESLALIGYTSDEKNVPPEISSFADFLIKKENVPEKLSRTLFDIRQIIPLRRDFNALAEKIIGISKERNDLIKNVQTILRKKVFSAKDPAKAGIVLIHGESGSGKELVAQLVACGQTPFIAVNCGAVPEALFDSEFFGHSRGAFTGANRETKGLFEEADGGILYLDEIAEMPLASQTKLLRVLQEGEIRPVGSTRTLKISVRVIAATNRDLKACVAQGTFREDLYYRLNIFPLYVPPLRKRKEDILPLAKHFAKLYSGKDIQFSKETISLLENYSWPGNIRELENAVHRATVLSENSILLPQDFILRPLFETNSMEPSTYKEFRLAQEKEEINFLLSKLQENRGSVSKTARALEMERTALYARAKRLGIDLKRD